MLCAQLRLLNARMVIHSDHLSRGYWDDCDYNKPEKAFLLGFTEISVVQKSRYFVLTPLMHAACFLASRLQSFMPRKWAHFQDHILTLHTERCTGPRWPDQLADIHMVKDRSCVYQVQLAPVVLGAVCKIATTA
jgi:hypothetical protein